MTGIVIYEHLHASEGAADVSRESELRQAFQAFFERYGTRRTFSAGQVIAEKGLRAEWSYFLTEGHVRTFCMNEEGAHITLFYLGPGNMLCSETLVSDLPINVSVETITDAAVLAIPAADFRRLILIERKLPVEDLLFGVVTRLWLMSDYICCAHLKTNKGKIAYFLLSACERQGESVVSYTNAQISDVTGINRVSVNRILNAFQKEGLLTLKYKKILIRDPERLREVYVPVRYYGPEMSL